MMNEVEIFTEGDMLGKKEVDALMNANFKDKGIKNKILAIIKRLFTRSDKEIISGIRKLLRFVVKWELYSAIAIGAGAATGLAPLVFMVPLILTDRAISKQMNRESVKKIIPEYEKTLAKLEERKKKVKDEKEKKAIEKSIVSTKKALVKLNKYAAKLQTHKTINEYYDSIEDKDEKIAFLEEMLYIETETSLMLEGIILDEE